jgi:hypothetical protein
LNDVSEEHSVGKRAARSAAQEVGQDGILIKGSREDADGTARNATRQDPDLGVYVPHSATIAITQDRAMKLY